MKRVIALCVALLTLVTLASCGENDTGSSSSAKPRASATSSAPVTTVAALPPTTAARPPFVVLRCSTPAAGPWSWFDETFGNAVVPGSAPIAHYSIDYGDGATYESDTPDLVFEHRYTSPGTFHATVVVAGSDGVSGQSACDVTWTSTSDGGSQGPTGPRIPYPGNGGGPTQCADGSVSGSSGPGTCSHHGGEAG
jgi:hypothetical protein